MSYAHTKRRKRIKQLKRQHGKGWLAHFHAWINDFLKERDGVGIPLDVFLNRFRH